MTRIKVSKEVSINGGTIEFSLDTSLGGHMDLDIKRLAIDQRDSEEHITLMVDSEDIDEIIETLKELKEKVQ